jgi:two-component system CheB/CheR fusion protein
MADRGALSGLRVLVVEDTDDIREVLHVLLQMDGAESRAFATGRAAVDAAAAWDFDILLTDLGLPDVPGEELITAILGMKARRPRVVVVTGFGEAYAARARRAGADVVITKPLDWSALRVKLTEADEALAA